MTKDTSANTLKTLIRMEDHASPTNLTTPLAGVDGIYYINMKRSKDRKKHMESLFKDPVFEGIPVTRIEAVDGTLEKADTYLEFHQTARNPYMMESEYGCTISHFRAIHQFAMTDDPVALIVEDDLSTEFLPYWKKTIQQHIDDAPPNWEILQLSYILFSNYHNEDYEFILMNKNFCGTAAYLIKNDAAKRLIQYLCKYSSPAMPRYCIGPEMPHYHHADRFLYTFFQSFSVKCPPFTYRDNNDSVIHPEHMDHHAESKEKTKRMYLGWPIEPEPEKA